MTFIDLRYILAVTEEGNITRAAQKLYISQPALSQRLQKVENELRSALFVRTVAGLEPTESGRMFADMARQVLAVYDDFILGLSVSAGDPSGLRVGIPPNQSRTLAPPLAEAFSVAHPAVPLTFKTGNSDWIEEEIISGEIDIGIVHNPFANARLAYRTLSRIPLRIYLRKNSPVAALARPRNGYTFPVLSIRDIRDEPIGVTLPGMRTRMLIDRCFGQEGVVPNIVQEMSAFESLRGIADGGICSILYPWSANSGTSQGTDNIFDIDSEHVTSLEVVLAYRADMELQ